MAIEEWAVGYEKRETMEFPAAPRFFPKAQIIQVRGAERVGRRVRFATCLWMSELLRARIQLR